MHIENTLKSLLSQTVECNVIIVDSCSRDDTESVVKSFKSDKILFKLEKSSRGGGRNTGVNLAESDKILFTDGDALPDEKWVETMSDELDRFDLVSGKTIQEGLKRYSRFQRVKLFYKGFEITAPSMNLGIKRDVFLNVGGFDDRMITAEDIDLNFRVIRKGYNGGSCENCIVYHQSRSNLRSFLKQAFWNGYGRAQLRYKNRDVFKQIEKGRIPEKEIGIIWFLRNAWAVMGYLWFIISGKRQFNSNRFV